MTRKSLTNLFDKSTTKNFEILMGFLKQKHSKNNDHSINYIHLLMLEKALVWNLKSHTKNHLQKDDNTQIIETMGVSIKLILQLIYSGKTFILSAK